MATSPETPESSFLAAILRAVQQPASRCWQRMHYGINSQELREDMQGFTRWLLVIPVVLVILFACGQVAILRQPAVAAADTRSKLSADYGPWEVASFAPVLIDIISEIRGEPQGSISEIVTAGDYWPGQSQFPQEPEPPAAGTPVAGMDTSTPSASPTHRPSQAIATYTLPAADSTSQPTLDASNATVTPGSTPSVMPTSTAKYPLVPSPSPTPTRRPHDQATATSTSTPVPPPSATTTAAPSRTPTPTLEPTDPPASATPAFTSTSLPSSTPLPPTSTPQPTSTPLPTDTPPPPPPTDTPTSPPTPTSTPVTPVPVETPIP